MFYGFLDNLDSLHYFIDHVVYKANLRGPSFRCEENEDGSITLHYFTGRPGLYPIVKGRDPYRIILRVYFWAIPPPIKRPISL